MIARLYTVLVLKNPAQFSVLMDDIVILIENRSEKVHFQLVISLSKLLLSSSVRLGVRAWVLVDLAFSTPRVRVYALTLV